jgi:hypothetical protein
VKPIENRNVKIKTKPILEEPKRASIEHFLQKELNHL